MNKRWLGLAALVCAFALILTGCRGGATGGSGAAAAESCTPQGGKAPRAGGKYVVYMSALNIGNAWQEEAANLGTAVAKLAPYSKCVEVRKQMTDPDPQAQISQIQSMVANGADAIVSYALSPTAINAAYKAACAQGVTVVAYDAAVTEPCVYDVSYITSIPQGSTHPFMGYNSMEGLVKLIGGSGDIAYSHGVLGTSTDNVHHSSALAAMSQHPGVKIVTEYNGLWDSAQQQKETAKMLASFPNVKGLWCGYGESGCLKALKAVGKKLPVSGETSQYFREQLQAGWPGISIGSPPAQGGIAMKVALAVLLQGKDGIPMNVEVPYKIVTAQNVKVCEKDTYTDGCNVFPKGKVGDEETADIFNEMLPEASLSASKSGNPPAGMTATPFTADYLKRFAQDPSRRYVTRSTCDNGWHKAMLPEHVEGCAQG